MTSGASEAPASHPRAAPGALRRSRYSLRIHRRFADCRFTLGVTTLAGFRLLTDSQATGRAAVSVSFDGAGARPELTNHRFGPPMLRTLAAYRTSPVVPTMIGSSSPS